MRPRAEDWELNHLLSGHNAKVVNFNSGCGLELPEIISHPHPPVPEIQKLPPSTKCTFKWFFLAVSLIHGTRITDDLPEETENDHECAFPQLTCDTQRVSGLEGLGYKAWMTRGVRVSETLGLLGISLDVSEAATGIDPLETCPFTCNHGLNTSEIQLLI